MEGMIGSASVRLALASLALALGPAGPVRAEVPYRQTLSSGYLDFERGMAVASGVAPRGEARGGRDGGAADRPRKAAMTNLEALLYPHPVDNESTLGDLAAFHRDLAAAIELQLAQATVVRREAIPPDLEQVVLELPLRQLTLALLPFLGAPGPVPPTPAPPPRTREGPSRVVLLLPPSVAREHVPPLLPSVRGLSGADVFPAGGAWLRRAFQEPVLRYMPHGWHPEVAEWTIPVSAAGGLAGSTLYLRDDHAEALRRALASATPPELLVADTSDEEPGEAAPGPSPRAELALGAPRRQGGRPSPTRFRIPEAPPPAAEPAAPEVEQPAPVAEQPPGATEQHAAGAPAAGPEATSQTRFEQLYQALQDRLATRTPRPPEAGPPPPREAPGPTLPPPPRRMVMAQATPSPAPARGSAGEDLARLPAPAEDPLDRALYGGGGVPRAKAPSRPRPAPPAAAGPDEAGEPPPPERPGEPELDWRPFEPAEAGEPPEIPGDIVEPPTIRWQYFRREDEAEGELP